MDDGSRILAGRYEVGELIGRGGMAEVHIGHDTRLGRTVAIKVLRSDLARDPSFQARFRREAQAAASLNHPAIVAVYDTGEDIVTEPSGVVAHVPFIVMEYVEGHTVRDILRDGNAVPIEEAAEITAGVLSALEYSHHAGIVHRDIKPANVMLTPTGAVKVMDFGIARAVADSAATMTQTQAVIGTAQYLSPEQARGETVDARSDLYSTGCLLFELLTGRPPFIGDSPVAVAYQHVREAAPTPSSIASDIPETLDRITLKALAKERDSRYSTAAEFRSDLEAAVRGGHVGAPPVGALMAAGSGDTTQVMGAAPGSTQVMQGAAVTAAGTPPWGMTSPGGPGSGLPEQPGADAEDEDAPKKRWLLWTLIAVALAAVIGIAALLIAQNQEDPPALVTIPTTLVDTPADEAVAKLSELGLVPVEESQASDSIAEGNVVGTDPKGGEQLDEGSEVTVFVSTGSDSVQLENLAGLTQQAARERLDALGLTLGELTTAHSPEQAAGLVVSTTPPAGQSVPKGSAVDLVVASGNVELPNLVDMTQADAEAKLLELKLTPVVEEEESDDAPAGTVIRQNRQEGLVQQGAVVRITVATARELPTVPDGLVGLTYEQAAARLDAVGLRAQRENVDSDAAKDTVISTNPAKGTQLEEGSTVKLSVSKGSSGGNNGNNPTPTPTPTANQ
ncbi:Stk1 family PASTA domain-containing Ser/Thr kinase [Cellulomonas cellasea]|uniref:Stk1 family PASTA domain-containing Ser/Thr kinase n=1 Tax=Cellulomonas cellasea TaxID=43670 RepID=UPI0025A4A081|nr:Stk1 family PASTA domain-containing Ser/Thr kinase [Cellulomonas cellasea]MDM8085158.1 Stk1 family PASTA domain-containing Ser/Thr kinase [Cellulomonas cellasea]